MSYVGIYCTKDDIASFNPNISQGTDIPDIIHKAGENEVTKRLKKNGFVDYDNINKSDTRLQLAAIYFTLWHLQKSGVIPGVLGTSGEISGKGAGGLNISYSGSRGATGVSRNRTHMQDEQESPDYYVLGQREINDYLQDPDVGALRPEEVTMQVANYREPSFKEEWDVFK